MNYGGWWSRCCRWSSPGPEVDGPAKPIATCCGAFFLCCAVAYTLGDAAPGVGLWLRHDVLAPSAGLGAGGRVASAAPGIAGTLGRCRPTGLESRQLGLGQHSGLKRGAQVGPNPTDRGKPGTKRNFVVERQGVPLAALFSPANVNDCQMLACALDAVPPVQGSRGRPRRRPVKLHADKAYDHAKCRQAVRRRGIVPRIARRGIDCSQHLGRYRWVVERTLAWLNGYRRLRIRYERRADIHQAWLTCGCALVCFQQLQRRFC